MRDRNGRGFVTRNESEQDSPSPPETFYGSPRSRPTGGRPAARATATHVCPMLTRVVPHAGGPVLPGCPTVPAACREMVDFPDRALAMLNAPPSISE